MARELAAAIARSPWGSTHAMGKYKLTAEILRRSRRRRRSAPGGRSLGSTRRAGGWRLESTDRSPVSVAGRGRNDSGGRAISPRFHRFVQIRADGDCASPLGG